MQSVGPVRDMNYEKVSMRFGDLVGDEESKNQSSGGDGVVVAVEAAASRETKWRALVIKSRIR